MGNMAQCLESGNTGVTQDSGKYENVTKILRTAVIIVIFEFILS